MDDAQFFNEFLIVLGVAAIVAFLLGRLKLPAILGFLLAGVVIGPHGLRLLEDTDRIHLFAETGMILLMLTIGLEFSFKELKGLGKIAFFGGLAQILLCIFFAMGFAYVMGWTMYRGFILGAVMALSSTAIVLKFLIDRGQLDTHQGKIAVALLVFQDLAVLPLIILLNSMGQPGSQAHLQLAYAGLKTLLLFGGGYVVTRLVFIRFIHWVALSRSRDLFLLTSTFIVFAMASFSNHLGLTFAIGAFLAGLVFANTDYGHQIHSDILPFRHIFVSLFFVSIGLLFDVHFALQHWVEILSVVTLVVGVKFLIVFIVVMCFGYPPRVSIATSLMITQMGEFSFLLLETGRDAGSIKPFFYNVLLSSAFLTMVLTPLFFAMIPFCMKISERIPFFGTRQGHKDPNHARISQIKGHVIVCGFGPVGKDLCFAFQEENIPFVLVEMNPARIGEAKEKGIAALYGDAANEEVLRRLNIHSARSVAVTFADKVGTSQIVRLVQRLNSDLHVVARTRYEREVAQLYESGADFVVMEELEASLEISRLILQMLGVEQKKIQEYLNRIRGRKELAIEEAIFKHTPEELT